MKLTERSADEMDDLYRTGEIQAERWINGNKTSVLVACHRNPALASVVTDCLLGVKDVDAALAFLGFLRNTKLED